MLPVSVRSGPELQVETGGACIPNPQKPNKLGEDSFFITKDSKSFGAGELWARLQRHMAKLPAIGPSLVGSMRMVTHC